MGGAGQNQRGQSGVNEQGRAALGHNPDPVSRAQHRDVILSLLKPPEFRGLWAKQRREKMEEQQRERAAAWGKIKGLERMAVKRAITGN